MVVCLCIWYFKCMIYDSVCVCVRYVLAGMISADVLHK